MSVSNIQDIRVDRLFVDHSVQRPLERPRVDKIAANFDLDAIGVIVVSARNDDTFHIVDGQHRVAAATAVGLGDVELTCRVYKGLDRAAEAAMFRLLNDTRRVSALDKFRVRVIEGDQPAVDLAAMLTRLGWTVTAGSHDGCFRAVAALESIYKAGGEYPVVPCEQTMRVITAAWDRNPDGARAELVAGIGAVILRHAGAADLRKLTGRLAQYRSGPLGVVGDAKALSTIRKGRKSDAVAEILINELNRGCRTRRLPQWLSS